jgi:hypothetical protein
MNAKLAPGNGNIASARVAVLALLMCGCGRPASEAAKQPSPENRAATSGPGSKNDAGGTKAGGVAGGVDMDVASVALRVLNTAHRNGAVILRGGCGPLGITETYSMPAPVVLEPMDKALQEVSARYQNIYWRESRASGARVVDSTAKAGLLRVRVREFRIVEDREPDGAMAALWRAPEVAAFLRKHHLRWAPRPGTAKKTISPPMIVEIKNATVADILDRIAAGYRADPPKVWIYRECADSKETLVDVEMK